MIDESTFRGIGALAFLLGTLLLLWWLGKGEKKR